MSQPTPKLVPRSPSAPAGMNNAPAASPKRDSEPPVAPFRASGSRPSQSPPSIPDHQLIRRIGSGSYGEVWLARNVMGSYRAVKLVYRSSFDSDRPFEREFRGIEKFEPISRSDPSQIPILHVGRIEDCFYYVMELADDANHSSPPGSAAGPPSSAARALDPATYVPKTLKSVKELRGRISFDDCLQIGLAITTALAHLHKNGLVHRDVKPSNIIYINGIPKLADIGLVTDFQGTVSFVGTEGFIPLEGPGTPQADLYALGKVLYEVSTGKDRQDYPEPPTLLGDFADREQLLELGELIKKACALKAPERYQTAESFHQDLLLLKAGKSLGRLHSIERRLLRARRAALITAVLLGIAIPGFLVAIYQRHQAVQSSLRAAKETQRALIAEADSREKLWGSYLAQSQALRSGHRADKRFAGLELVKKAAAIRPDLMARNEAIACLAVPGVKLLTEEQRKNPGAWIINMDAIPPLFFESEQDGVIVASQMADERLLYRLPGFGTPAQDLFLSPDKRLLCAGYTQQGAGRQPRPTVWIWDLEQKEVLLRPAITNFRCAAFSLDGNLVAIAQNLPSRVTVYQMRPERELWSFAPATLPYSIAFDPSSTKLACTFANDSVLQILDIKTRNVVQSLTHPRGTHGVAWHPQGNLLATACADSRIYIWDVPTGKTCGVCSGHESSAFRVHFNSDGRLLATCGWDGQFRLWDPVPGGEIGSLGIDCDEFAISSDDRFIGFSGYRMTGLLEFASGLELKSLQYGGEPQNQLWQCSFSPDGRVIAVGYDDGVRFWDSKTAAQLGFLPMFEARTVFFSPSADSLLTCSAEGLRQWPVHWSNSDTNTSLAFGSPESLCDGGLTSQRSTDEHAAFITLIRDGQLHLFNLKTRQDRILSATGISFRNACLSPNARWCAACTETTNRVFIFDLSTASLARSLSVENVRDLKFSPDGHLLITCGLDECRVWTTGDWNCAYSVLRSNTGGLHGPAEFSPDGAILAVAPTSRSIRLLEPNSGRELATLEPFETGSVGSFAFSPDCSKLAVSGWKHAAQIWDLALIRKELAAMNLDWTKISH